MKILLVEDETAISTPLKRSLENAGFAVDTVENGKEALEYIHINAYDCVLLDLNLPEMSGLEVAAQLRDEKNTTPIIMLTARSQQYDKLEGFALGTDDYITKPFHVEELIARVRAVIKRSSEVKTTSLQFGDIEFSPEKNEVLLSVGESGRGSTAGKKQKRITLTSKETAILEYLYRHNERIISTEEILEHVWDREVNLFTDTVKTHMKTLRQKIDPEKTLIETVRGKGYRLNI